MHLLVQLVFLIGFVVNISGDESLERIECFPERESNFSFYSRKACLDRGCEYDDTAESDTIQCYLKASYGYVLQETPIKTEKGFQLKLRRNEAVNSMFPDPINNVTLDVQYYTNDILRFRLYDTDNQRYEV